MKKIAQGKDHIIGYQLCSDEAVHENEGYTNPDKVTVGGDP